MKYNRVFSQDWEIMRGPTHYQFKMRVLTSATRYKNKSIHNRKEEIKLCQFPDHMIVYEENSKEPAPQKCWNK